MIKENCILTDVLIDDIIIGERIRKQFDESYISLLAHNIEEDGLDDPISLMREDGRLYLLDGECRIRAHKKLNRIYIPAFIKEKDSIPNPSNVEINRNNIKKDFSPIEKYESYQKLEAQYKRQIKGRIGRPQNTQHVDINENKSVDNCPHFSPLPGEKTRDYLARRSGFNNYKTYERVKSVMVSDCKKEIVDAMGKEIITPYRAAIIASQPTNKQLTLLEEAVKDPDTLTTDLKKSSAARRKANRKKMHDIPPKYEPHPIYNIIRVAPDWSKTRYSDIQELPVPDYMADTQCIVAIETDMNHLPAALNCINIWGFKFLGLYTVWNPRREAYLVPTGLPSIYGTYHIVIGVCNGGNITDYRVTIAREKLVFERYSDISASLISILNELFPNKSDKRIDMTSAAKIRGWISWKTYYGVSKDPEEEPVDESPDEPEIPEKHDDLETVEFTENQPEDLIGLLDDDQETTELAKNQHQELKLFPDEDEVIETFEPGADLKLY